MVVADQNCWRHTACGIFLHAGASRLSDPHFRPEVLRGYVAAQIRPGGLWRAHRISFSVPATQEGFRQQLRNRHLSLRHR